MNGNDCAMPALAVYRGNNELCVICTFKAEDGKDIGPGSPEGKEN